MRGSRAGAVAGLKKRRDLAALMGVQPEAVYKWERQGLTPAVRGSRGRPSLYDPEAVRAWLDARSKAASTEGGELNPAQEKAARDHWQAVLAQQTYQVRQRNLLPADEVLRTWTAEIAAVRSKLLALPTTFSDRIYRAGTLDGLPGVEKTLQAAVYDVLRQLSGISEAESGAA
jgi:phage terminase Nu1 subunit (DNA packaging protein)